MKRNWLLFVAFVFAMSFAVSFPLIAQEEKGEKAKGGDEKKAEGGEKAKAEKAKGDVGLLDTDKNYMILVTKEGKLITLDFDQKTKVSELEEKPVKMGDVGLGSAADVEYQTKGEKKVITKMEFRPAKGE
ncbi:MAG TPA: hypothetical protein VGH50_03195 [Candidatus Binatia bacterium]|jgi:hypothetical protein